MSRITKLELDVKEHDKLIRGNGTPGIVTRITVQEGRTDDMRKYIAWSVALQITTMLSLIGAMAAFILLGLKHV
jgi:hypothetical protein